MALDTYVFAIESTSAVESSGIKTYLLSVEYVVEVNVLSSGVFQIRTLLSQVGMARAIRVLNLDRPFTVQKMLGSGTIGRVY